MPYSRLIVFWLVVSLALLRVMGVHVHARAPGGKGERPAVEVHVFDAGLHGEQHADEHGAASEHVQPHHGVGGHLGPHLESHLVHGERDIPMPGEIGKLPKPDLSFALLFLALLVPWWLPSPPLRRATSQPEPRARRPAHFAPPTQAPPLTA